jgi:hypothetical protein
MLGRSRLAGAAGRWLGHDAAVAGLQRDGRSGSTPVRGGGQKGGGLLGLLLIIVALAALYVAWPTLRHMTADRTGEDGMVWLYATDVAPGDVIEGRVRVEGGLRLAITRVVVRGAGADQSTAGRSPTWDDTLRIRLGGPTDAVDELAFAATIPADAAPGRTLDLEIAVEFVRAERGSTDGARVTAFGFHNQAHQVSFRARVPVYRAATSVLRRVGKAALATLAWLAVIGLVVAVRRWHARRNRAVGGGWALLM